MTISTRIRADITELRAYLPSLKYHFMLSLLLFFVSIILGYIYGFFTYSPGGIVADEFAPIEVIFEWIRNLPAPVAAIIVYINNLKTAVLAALLGFGLGIIPVFIIVSNGFLAGLVIYTATVEKGIIYIALAILPHGVLEIAMILLSTSIGLRLGNEAANALRGRKTDLRREFLNGMRALLYLVVPMLLLAAFIEMYVTAALVMPLRP
jgi:stage II sporulation protein M